MCMATKQVLQYHYACTKIERNLQVKSCIYYISVLLFKNAMGQQDTKNKRTLGGGNVFCKNVNGILELLMSCIFFAIFVYRVL